MFVYFKVNNYKSFGSEGSNNTLSMQYYPDKDFSEEEYKAENHINTKNSKYEKLSRKKAIYGNNGAGKSNFIYALGHFKYLVHNRLVHISNTEVKTNGNINVAMDLEYEFGCIINGSLFEYTISCFKNKIVKEKLVVDNKVLKRDLLIHLNKFYKYVNNNILIFNGSLLSEGLVEGFPKYKEFPQISKDKQNDFVKDMVPYLKSFDVGIDNVEFDSADYIVSINKNGDRNYSWASLGTISLLRLSEYFDRILKKGGCLFVDDIELNKHPLNISYLLSYIASLETNKNNPQIVFTSHNTRFIDYVVDANQIAIIEKDPETQYSRILELNKQDIDILTYNNLPVKNFVNKYYAGIFGGVPTSSVDELYESIIKAINK